MTANMGQVRTIARSLVVLGCVGAALPNAAQGQTSDQARSQAVDSALRTYRLPGLVSSSGNRLVAPMRAPSPAPYVGWRRPADNIRTMIVPTIAAESPSWTLECPMPVALDASGTDRVTPTRAAMDSMAANPPGSPMPMPTRRHPCVNRLAK